MDEFNNIISQEDNLKVRLIPALERDIDEKKLS
jgi:hypothetical protein